MRVDDDGGAEGRVNGSFHIQWHVTERCNLHCRHCYAEPAREELQLEALLQAADRLQEFAATRNLNLVITLTGGEPFLSTSVYDLAAYLDGLPRLTELNFITNGTVMPVTDYLHRLSRLNMMYISIESHHTAVNDAIRGTGVLEKACDNARRLATGGFATGIMTTLMNRNIGSIMTGWKDFMALVKRLKTREVIFERFVPVGQATPFRDEVVSEAVYGSFLDTLARYCEVETGEMRQFKAFKLIPGDGPAGLMGADCTSGRDGAAILCDGTIYPCRRLPIPLGNILVGRLTDYLPADLPKLCQFANNDFLDCLAISRSLNR